MTLTVLLVEVFCGPLPVAADAADTPSVNAVFDADNCSLSRQVLGTACHVTCPPGFQLGHPAENYTCQYDGCAFWYPPTPPACYGKLPYEAALLALSRQVCLAFSCPPSEGWLHQVTSHY